LAWLIEMAKELLLRYGSVKKAIDSRHKGE